VVDERVREPLAVVDDATRRLVDSLHGVDDAWCRTPSRLPRWSRGHVLTHLARNADALDHLASATARGDHVSMYGPEGAREADIEAGAGRPADELVWDVRDSAARLLATCQSLPDDRWDLVAEWRAGRRQPLRDIPLARVVEVEVHRVDLGTGYRPEDWPGSSTDLLLTAALARLAGTPHPPQIRLDVDDGMTAALTVGDDPAPVTVGGPAGRMVTWLMGRDDGAGLRCDGPLPHLPAAWA